MRALLLIILILEHIVSFGQFKAQSDTCSFGLPITKEPYTIPQIQAEYPGGYKKMLVFINQNVTQKINITESELKVFQTPVAQWTIDENGNVIDAKIIRTSKLPKIDNLYLEAIKSMPTWKPAEKFDKKYTRQEFRFPLKICFK